MPEIFMQAVQGNHDAAATVGDMLFEFERYKQQLLDLDVN